jgi:drug/metabolite transporter (DMT)-like permease
MSMIRRGMARAIQGGAGAALLSAVLFGASTPLAKLLLRGIDPWMLAGILYLGSGVGLAALRVVTAASRVHALETRVQGRGWLSLGAAILSGGIAAPVLLMIGLTRTSATTAALLLNLESVFTVLLARFVFGENLGRRITAGVAAIVGGGAILAGGDRMTGDLLGPVIIAAACLGWSIDNNLTRYVSSADPVYVATLKGGVAGIVNVAIARWLGSPWPDPTALSAAALLGFAGYGISLVLFVIALRHAGVARTAGYFSLAPFFGGALAVVVFRETVTLSLVGAGVLMAVGVWLLLTERHEHEHWHGASSGAPPEDVRHTHPHYPDSDHRHGH